MTSARSSDYPDLDNQPGDSAPSRFSPELEIGKTGLRRVSGYVEEEFLPQLKGSKGVAVYREMSDNSPIIGALLFAIVNLIRQIEWRVEPATTGATAKADAKFLEECKDDMSHSWGDLITELCSMLPYGWSLHEMCYKRRIGPWETDSKKRSKYTDGKIGWRKMPIRGQDTMLRWIFDEQGGIRAMVQMSPPDYKTVVLPIEKCLLFRTTTAKGNPQGRSLLRNAYFPYYMAKRIMESEAVGAERDLAGMPMARVPAAYLNPNATPDQQAMVNAVKKMVRSVRRDEQEGIVFPKDIDPDSKESTFDFELLASGGSRQFDTNGIIERYENRMLMSVLADFIMVGHEETGSYSMHTDKRGLFQTALNAITQNIADVFNRYAIPRLFALNGMKPAELPKIVPNDVDPPDLTQLSAFMTAMTSAGLQWFPDPELEKFVRDAARLPEMNKDVEKVREAEQRQALVMSLAQSKLQAIQIDQQAQQGELAMQSQQMQTETQRRELKKPGSTLPPQKAAPDKPAKVAPGKPAPAKSNAPGKAKR